MKKVFEKIIKVECETIQELKDEVAIREEDGWKCIEQKYEEIVKNNKDQWSYMYPFSATFIKEYERTLEPQF